MRNAKLRMRPWRPGDEAAFTPRADFAEEAPLNGWDWRHGAPGPTWTLERWNGEIAGVGGGVPQGEGLFDVWACLAATVGTRDWPRLLWLASRALALLTLHHGARRFQALARADWEPAIDSLRRLAFRREDAAGVAGYQIMRRWS